MQTSKLIFFIFVSLYLISASYAEDKSDNQKNKTNKLRWLSGSDQFVIYQKRKINKSRSHFLSFGSGKYDLNGVSVNRDHLFSYKYYSDEKNGYGAYFVYSTSSTKKDLRKVSNSDLLFNNQSKMQYGLIYDWVPIYGKHLYKSNTFYTDMGISFLLGMSIFKNNSNLIKNSNSSLPRESTKSFDFGLEPFLRVFIHDKYFIKISLRIRNSTLKESIFDESYSDGLERDFISSTNFSVGIKI